MGFYSDLLEFIMIYWDFIVIQWDLPSGKHTNNN